MKRGLSGRTFKLFAVFYLNEKKHMKGIQLVALCDK